MYFLRTTWGWLGVMGVFLIVVGRTLPLVAIGVVLALPGAILLPARLRVSHEGIVTRNPFLLTRRNLGSANISQLTCGRGWQGYYGTWGVSAVMSGGDVIPIVETMSFTSRGARRWMQYLSAKLDLTSRPPAD
jgi:hypothetical protein